MNSSLAFAAVIQLLLLWLGISIHEAAHAWAAARAGDPTARDLGRATLNPLRHLDPFGALLFPCLLLAFGLPVFGWGRPAPVVESKLRLPGRGGFFVFAAGPLANLLLAALLFTGTYVAGVPGQRAMLAQPPAASAAAAADVRGGDLVIAVDGEPVGSLQELRWHVVRAQGHDALTLTLVRDNASAEPIDRRLSLAGMTTDDWEGNPLASLGLRADLGAPIVDAVLPGKPAERAGLRHGDRIVAVDGRPMSSPSDVAAFTNAQPGATLVYRIARDGATLDVPVTIEAVEQNGRRIGQAGVRLRVDPQAAERAAVVVRYGLGEAFAQGARKTWELSAFTVRMLGRIVTGDASLKNISGPLTMADIAGQSAQAGMLVFVSYLALISISLGVLNLLPVPLLDGGHLLYYLAEIVKGSPVSDRAFEVGQLIGMAMLAVMMALALFNDVSRLF